jgi:hypothetical protein
VRPCPKVWAWVASGCNLHRGKGQQKVTVEHVHVHEGGQAIVGNVLAGGGVASKPEGQPHAIAYAPGQMIQERALDGERELGDGHSQRIRRKTMLKFDDDFVAAPLACILWADAPSAKRVRFLINRLILTDVLSGGNPVDDDANLALCRAERARIEAACTHAFASRPADHIELRRIDFQ